MSSQSSAAREEYFPDMRVGRRRSGSTVAVDVRSGIDHRGHVALPPEQAVSFYKQFITEGDLVFDVGANIGNRSGLFLELGANVVAFEPQPDCARTLRDKYGSDAFTLLRLGLGAAPGHATPHLADPDVLASTSREFQEATTAAGRFTPDQWVGKSIEIRVTTLDTAITMFGTPAFTKIDVEGGEPEVLAGPTSPLPALSFEFAREVLDHVDACLDHLARLGNYRVAFSLGESLILSPWGTPDRLRADLERLPDDLCWGDVYAARVLSCREDQSSRSSKASAL
jgi:FkbM family methyltransferase